MPMPGYVFKDGGPIPDDDLTEQQINQNTPGNITRPSTTNSSTFNTPTSSTSALNAPSDSHALAVADHEDKGVAQHNASDNVKDLGWDANPKHVPTMVGGLPNSELWMLVRRFDKQMYRVKATTGPLPGGLDLNIVDEDDFSPDKLRSNIERLYMTVIIGLMGFGNHIARLRSWREPRRTMAFAAGYALAWFLNLLIPTCFTTLIVLIVYPPSRPILFPPAPLALINSSTGGIQSPKAGVLGSHDSATGAPEKHHGEAVEQEASNFVTGIGSIALSSATGKSNRGEQPDDALSKSVPDPTRLAGAGATAKASTGGGMPTSGQVDQKTASDETAVVAHHDKTKQPMEEAMWSKMRPAMHVVGDIADGWERFANALSPTPPFPKDAHRLRLAGVLVPAVAVALFTTPAMVMKVSSFGVGFGFFGDPLIWRGLDLLNRYVPNWPDYVQLRNTILKGVPTNAQLTITLLRIGEANKAPLPPPPSSDQPPSEHPKELDVDDLAVDASNGEIHEAIHKDPAEIAAAEKAATEKPKHRHGEHILGFFKGTTKTSIETKLGVDKVRAKIGSEHAKNHLGVLPKPSEQAPTGPVDFKARHNGNKGWVYISTGAPVPTVSFSKTASDGSGITEQRNAVFSIPIQDITELKKVGGLGWKAKLVVGWATGRNVADGLEIVDRSGKTWKLTACNLRDPLFNRLIAIGGQKWESW